MSGNRIRLLGLDIDGTLVNGRKEITQPVRKALRSAREAGISLAYVTGRPEAGLRCGCVPDPHINYGITSNGAIVWDCTKRQIIRKKCLNGGFSSALVEYCLNNDMIYNVFWGGYGYCDALTFHQVMDLRKKPPSHYMKATRRPVRDIFAVIKSNQDEIENIWIHPPCISEIETIKQQIISLDRSVQIVVTDGIHLEVGAAGADKGEAFLALSEHLGYDRDETAAVGDDLNDMGLLRAAGLSIAMGNARLELAAICDAQVSDNEHDGVAEAIERYCL